MFQNACEGVGFAHSRGVIHRDLKPDNIMIGEYGEVLVLDWGLAKVVGAEPPPPTPAVPDPAALRLPPTVQTEAGAVAGTPAYMAPEQVRGDIDQHDERTDLYGLGVVLYEILTWRRPFEGATIKDVMAAIVSGRVVPPRQAAPRRRIPRELEAICLKALACRREDRYLNVQELIDDLASYRDHFPVAALPLSPVRRLGKFCRRHLVASSSVGAVLAVLLIGGLAYAGRAADHYYSLASRADAYRVRGSEACRQERQVLDEIQAARAAADRDLKTPAELALENRLERLHRQRESAYESAVVLYLAATGDVVGSARLRQGLLEIYGNRIHYALATENYGEAGYWLDFVRSWAGQDFGRVPPADRARLERLAADVAGDGTLAVDSQPAGAAVTLWQLRPGPNGAWVPAEPSALGRTPVAAFPVAKGSYVLTFSRPDRPEVRWPVFVKHGEHITAAPCLPRQIPEDMIYVPAGRFYAGAREANGGGLRELEVAGFFMKAHEVTFREYLRFWLDPAGGKAQPRFVSRLSLNLEERRLDDAWDAQGKILPPLTEDLPVVGITHDAAVAYCEWLSRNTGLPYRLPSADEWEKAARGVDGREYVWGDRYDPTFSLTRETPAVVGRAKFWAPPGSFPTDCSVYGVWDMGGNAREWTSSPLPDGDPSYQIKGTSVVGGHRALHVYDADDSPMETYDVGFRYAMSLPADACD